MKRVKNSAAAKRRPMASLNEKGFTLVELMVTMTIMLLLLAAVSTAIYSALNTYRVNAEIAHTTMANAPVETILREELLYARDIRVSDDGRLVTYDSQRYGNDIQIFIMTEADDNYSEELRGLPVMSVSGVTSPLLYKEHITSRNMTLQFSLEDGVLTVEIQNGSSYSELIMQPINNAV